MLSHPSQLSLKHYHLLQLWETSENIDHGGKMSPAYAHLITFYVVITTYTNLANFSKF